MQALCPDVTLKHLPFLRLRAGLPVNQDVVDAALSVAEAKAAGFTPPLKKQVGQRVAPEAAGVLRLFAVCAARTDLWKASA